MEFSCKIKFLNKHSTATNEFKLHTHNCYEIVYFLSGTGDAIIRGSVYPILPDAYCIIPPQTEHTERMDGDGEILFIGFEYKGEENILQSGVHHPTDATILSIFKKIIDEYVNQHIGYKIAAKALLDLLLVTSVRETGTVVSRCRDMDYIKAYIGQYFNQKINLKDLADLSGYSYNYFGNVFKSKFGVSPQSYMINKRLSHAKYLLETTQLSCTEIAYQCGFSNSAQMSMMFKKKFGRTPSAVK